jgi:hypothetical protein
LLLAILIVLMLVIAFKLNEYKAIASMRKEGLEGVPDPSVMGDIPDAMAIAEGNRMPGMGTPANDGSMPSSATTPIDMSTAGANPGPCAAGMTPVTYQNPDGSLLTRCVSSGPSVVADPTAILAACGMTWDPAATAEAQALATVGSFQHDGYGERKLQNAINAAYDSNVGITDDQLAQVMAGGTP